MSFVNFLTNLIPSSYGIDGEVFGVLLGAIGSALDQYDPYFIEYNLCVPGVAGVLRNTLASEFSVSTAIGPALDTRGNDWGVPRNIGENDNDFRQRIKSELSIYVNGPTVSGIETVVELLTGSTPTIFEYGPGSFTMGDSMIGDSGFSAATDLFEFEIHVQNQNWTPYNHQVLESAISKAKMARSTAIIYHSGADTSILTESPNAIVSVT